MKRKGLAIIDVLVALVVLTIIGFIIGKYIVGILDINRQIELANKFEQVSNYVESALSKHENIAGYVVTPRAILSPKATSVTTLSSGTLQDLIESDPSSVLYVNYEKALYGCQDNCENIDEYNYFAEDVQDYNKNLFSNFYYFTIYNLDDEDAMKAQKDFLQIPENVALKYGSMPFIFVMQRYSEYQGYKFPYKIVTVATLGPFLYKKLKTFFQTHGANDNQRLMGFLFPITDNGVNIRSVIDFEKIKENDNDLYELLSEFLGTAPEKVFAENKKYFRIKIINTAPYVRKLMEETVNQMNVIKKNIEDWAVIQARIAAYDSVNGNSMDKDYFVTCTSDGCDLDNGTVDKTKTLKPNLTDDAKIYNSADGQSTNSNDIDEFDLSNGFFVCEDAVEDQNHFAGYKCSQETPSAISQDVGCDSKAKILSNSEDYIEVFSATRFDLPADTENNKCLLSEASRKLLSSTGFTQNPFGIPLYFTNSNKATVSIDDDNLLNKSGVSAIFEIEANVPLVDETNNPPYTANIFTVMPWFAGGYEENGYPNAEVYVNSIDDTNSPYAGFGVIVMPLFAHVF